ncbi:MAG: hypothetical protein KC983_02035, partial [Phycisphaerales bacterium]|nr:hypothetical protein [Phycisphaerales bacterium]
MHTRFATAATASVLISAPIMASSNASFQSVGLLPGATSTFVYSMSADGNAIVGRSGTTAFLWTPDSGILGLGKLTPSPGDISSSTAQTISADGTVIAGQNLINMPDCPCTDAFAVRWTAPFTTIEALPGLSNIDVSSNVYDITENGSILVGQSRGDDGAGRSVRWSGSTIELLLPGQIFEVGVVWSIADDGSVALGQGSGQYWVASAPDFTAEIMMVPTQLIPFVKQLSPDGSLAVGSSLSSSTRATLFNHATGTATVLLDCVPGNDAATDISADNSIVVGTRATGQSPDALIWYDIEQCAMSIKDRLTNEFGLNLAGWELSEAVAVSADGTTIAG